MIVTDGHDPGRENARAIRFGLVRHVEFDERYVRPTEVDLLIGDYSKAKKELGWEPKTRMQTFAELMTDADYQLARSGRLSPFGESEESEFGGSMAGTRGRGNVFNLNPSPLSRQKHQHS